MNRRTLGAAVAAFALIGVSQASAQTLGFKVGASFANWDMQQNNVSVEGTSTLTSFMGGGFIRFGAGRIAIQPELNAVTRGFKEDLSGSNSSLKVDYVEVPVLLVLGMNMGTGMGISPYLAAGPSFAFEVKCSVDGGDIGGTTDCGDNGERKSLDMGLTGAAGIEFPMGPGHLLIEGRYNYGLSNISDDPSVEIKSRTAAILAGYSIPLGAR